MKLILASASPRRLELLTRMGFAPDKVAPADIDETPKKGEKPLDYCKRVAKEKAEVIAKQYPDSFILSADTTAVAGNVILGKPEDRADAKRIILKMAGRKHQVHTAICIITPKGEKRSKVVSTTVRFKNLNDHEVEEYLDTNQWEGKAGAYGLQEDPGAFVIDIQGSFSSVIGLPMYETKNLLLSLGYKK